jgi:hypothetical protein
MKNHQHDIAIFFSDPQDRLLGEMARRWPPLERKITPSLYNLVIFCFALFAFSAISFAASDAKKSNPVTKPTIVLVHGLSPLVRIGEHRRDAYDTMGSATWSPQIPNERSLIQWRRFVPFGKWGRFDE